MASQAWNPLGPCPAPPSTSLSGGCPRSGPRFSSCLFLLLLARNFCLCSPRPLGAPGVHLTILATERGRLDVTSGADQELRWCRVVSYWGRGGGMAATHVWPLLGAQQGEVGGGGIVRGDAALRSGPWTVKTAENYVPARLGHGAALGRVCRTEGDMQGPRRRAEEGTNHMTP